MKRSKDEFFERISLKDHKTVTAYRNRIKSFEQYLSEKSMDFEELYHTSEERLDDILQGFINWFAKNHSPTPYGTIPHRLESICTIEESR